MPGDFGYLGILTPLLIRIDEALGFLPPVVRILLWSAVAGFLSMTVYRLLSRQERMSGIKQEMLALRRRIAAFEGDFEALWPLLRRNLALSMRHLGLSFLPAMVAGLPVVAVLLFLSDRFDARLPEPGDPVTLVLHPADDAPAPLPRFEGGRAEAVGEGRWQLPWPPADAPVRVLSPEGRLLVRLPLSAPVPVVARRRWWNDWIGNPAGYLPDDAGVEEIEIGLPALEVVPWGPAWMRGWLPLSLVVIVLVSLFLKWRWRLH